MDSSIQARSTVCNSQILLEYSLATLQTKALYLDSDVYIYLRKTADELIRQHSEILVNIKRARKQAYRPMALNTKQKKEVKRLVKASVHKEQDFSNYAYMMFLYKLRVFKRYGQYSGLCEYLR